MHEMNDGSGKPSYRTRYHDHSDADFCDLFYKTCWDGLSGDNRLSLLQELENRKAVEQGRPNLPVIPQKMVGFTYGELSPSHDAIYINESTLEDACFLSEEIDGQKNHEVASSLNASSHNLNNQELYKHVPIGNSNAELMDTVLHEGRHAYQLHCMENTDQNIQEESKINLWRMNIAASPVDDQDSNYIPYKQDPDLYRIQPLEKDAFSFAETETRKIFENIQQRNGYDEGFEQYQYDREADSTEIALRTAQQKTGNENIEDKMIENMERNYSRYQDEQEILNLSKPLDILNDENKQTMNVKQQNEINNENTYGLGY